MNESELLLPTETISSVHSESPEDQITTGNRKYAYSAVFTACVHRWLMVNQVVLEM